MVTLSDFYKISINKFFCDDANVIIQENHNNPNANIAGSMNIDNQNLKYISLIEKRNHELEEKLSRRDAKIESLKKEIELLLAGKK